MEEVRRRQALNRYGRRWDLIQMGILQREWVTTYLLSYRKGKFDNDGC